MMLTGNNVGYWTGGWAERQIGDALADTVPVMWFEAEVRAKENDCQ